MKKETATIKALKILLNEKKPITAKHFAHLMWPDSPAWRYVHNTGPNGATSGKGMWLAAGSFLAKLVNKGFVYKTFDRYTIGFFSITHKGKEAIHGA